MALVCLVRRIRPEVTPIMASRREQEIDHILRRAGFGATQEEVDIYARLAFGGTTFALARLLSYKQIDDVVDDNIGKPGYVAITARGEFLPTANITDARQRWLFRMVHTERPLQEKMALFWHNHFATGYTKIAGELTATEATRVLAAKPTEDPGGVKGQLELFRERALGNFRDLLVAVAQDPAMLVWLDGRSNFRRQPQENFARELMNRSCHRQSSRHGLCRGPPFRGRAGSRRTSAIV